MKKCSKCSNEYEETVDNFSPDRGALSAWCRTCKSDYHKELYKKDPSRKLKLLERNEARQHDIRLKVMDHLYKNPCVKCGEDNPLVLDFDHLEDKDFSISRAILRTYGWSRIEKEIQKCQVLCANCHRIKTAEDLKFWKLQYLRSLSPTAEAIGREPIK